MCTYLRCGCIPYRINRNCKDEEKLFQYNENNRERISDAVDADDDLCELLNRTCNLN